MYELSYFILNIFMVIVTIWMVNKFLNIFLQKKRTNFISITIWIIFFMFQLFLQYNIGNASGWITIVGIIFVLFIAISSFYSMGRKIFFVVLIFYAIGALTEMIVFYGIDFFNILCIEANLFGQVISKILMVIVIYVISNFWKKEDTSHLPSKTYFILFIIPIGSIYIAIQTFFSMKANYSMVSAMIIFSFLLSFNIVIFEIYSKLIQFFTFEKEKTVYAQQMYIISRSTEEQRKVMENFHEEKHNLVNELIVLKHNFECSDRESLINNLNQIIHACEDKESISSCGNNIVDAIINFKYALAKERGITFSLKIFIPEELPFNQCDMGIVIGNAIDNAIEAVSQCINQENKINIVMGVKKESFIMVVKNSFNNKVIKNKEGNLMSTKKDFLRHGYGIKAIQKVVEKYNGEIIIETKDNVFSLIVAMNL